MTNTKDDKIITRGKSPFIFFLAFLIYCKKENISITKPDMKDFSSLIFHVMGNKKWLRDTFYSMFEQPLEEKNTETTLDLFGGSGVLTGYVQDYCYKNNLTLESRYNDLDENKLNFFKQLTKSPKGLEKKCRQLLEMYDNYKVNEDTENIFKLKENTEALITQKGLHGAAAFWYINTMNEKVMSISKNVNLQKNLLMLQSYIKKLSSNVVMTYTV